MRRWVELCAIAGVVGGGFFTLKGLIRATDGADVSLVPAALFGVGFGLVALAHIVRATTPNRWTVPVGLGLGIVGIACGGVGFVLTGSERRGF